MDTNELNRQIEMAMRGCILPQRWAIGVAANATKATYGQQNVRAQAAAVGMSEQIYYAAKSFARDFTEREVEALCKNKVRFRAIVGTAALEDKKIRWKLLLMSRRTYTRDFEQLVRNAISEQEARKAAKDPNYEIDARRLPRSQQRRKRRLQTPPPPLACGALQERIASILRDVRNYDARPLTRSQRQTKHLKKLLNLATDAIGRAQVSGEAAEELQIALRATNRSIGNGSHVAKAMIAFLETAAQVLAVKKGGAA